MNKILELNDIVVQSTDNVNTDAPESIAPTAMDAPPNAENQLSSESAKLLSMYENHGFKLLRLKGLKSSYASIGENAYREAKAPIPREKEFTKINFVSRPKQELEGHLQDGGWLGALIPAGFIALDVDKNRHSIKQALDLIRYRRYTANIAETKNGYHIYFKDTLGLKGKDDVWVKHGYKLTYRAGGKNYCVVPPSDGRTWTTPLTSMEALTELPEAFQPLDLKNRDELSRAVAHQFRYCWKNELLSGNEHIDMAFMGWLVKTLNYKFENVADIFRMIYQDEYDENKTRLNFERLTQIGEATGYTTLSAAIEKVGDLTYLSELLGLFSKVCALEADHKVKEKSEGVGKLSEEELGLNIIGYNGVRKILAWSDGKIHQLGLTEVNRAMYQLLTGRVIQSGNEKHDHWPRYQSSIIDIASRKGLVDENEKIKTGIWKFGTNFFILSGLTVLKIDGQTCGISELNLPIISKSDGGGTNILLSLNKNGRWLNKDHFQSVIVSEIAGTEMLKSAYVRLYNLVSQWNWKSPEMASYITAAVMLTPMQHAMKWRPIVYLTGERNSGKTFFYESIPAGLFSTLVLRQERTTAHSILQTYGNTSHFMILDEFEKYNKIPQILEMLKMCGWGGVAKSGTPGEDALEYKIKHMPWLSSTSPQYNDAAQVSRMIVFDLIKPEKRKLPVLPCEEDLSRLGAEIIAALIKTWPLLDEQFDYYQQNASLFNCDGRMLNNTAYMIAVQNLVFDRGMEKIQLPDFITTPIVEDRDNLLNNILYSQIQIDTGTTRFTSTIINVLTDEKTREMRQDQIGRNYGVRLYTDNQGRVWLAINEGMVKRYVLKDILEYKEMNISTALLRIPGAKKEKIRLAKGEGNPQHCVLLPIEKTPLHNPDVGEAKREPQKETQENLLE